MPNERLPKKILYGGPKKRYKDTLKTFIKDYNIPTESWEQITQDWVNWRGLIRRGASEYEAKKNQRSQAETCPAESQSKDITNRASFFLRLFLLYFQQAI